MKQENKIGNVKRTEYEKGMEDEIDEAKLKKKYKKHQIRKTKSNEKGRKTGMEDKTEVGRGQNMWEEELYRKNEREEKVIQLMKEKW